MIKRWQGGDRRPAACLSCNNCVERLKQGSGLLCRPLEPQEKETFYAQQAESLPAGPPFPSNMGYRVSFGLEEWEGKFLPVIKVQMVRDGQILNAGISFPAGTEDFEKISRIVKSLV